MKEWQKAIGEQFRPSVLLEKMVAEGKRFQDLK
jgi:hypothetical protein